MKKILVPVDFSASSQSALDVALAIAAKANAEIVLLHVVELSGTAELHVTGEITGNADWEDKLFNLKLIEQAKTKLGQWKEKVTAAGRIVHSELRAGNPFRGIDQLITSHQADLVVVGSTGHTVMEKLIVGSTTEKVIRHATCPVLTVSEGATINGFANIVYATSLLPGEYGFYKVLRTLQELFHSHLHLVWINTPLLFQPDMAVRKALQDFATHLSLSDYTLHTYSDYTVEEGIVHFAESMQAGMVAMATHRRKGLAHALTGSVAELAATQSKIPVLTYVVKE